MSRRERGTGGLIRRKGCRYWYASIYRDGKQRRVSTKMEIKQEAQGFLRRLLSDKDSGKQFVGDLNKLHYGNLREALIHNYRERANKSLRVTVDGDESICGLPALDKFFEYEADKKPGWAVAKITTDAARKLPPDHWNLVFAIGASKEDACPASGRPDDDPTFWAPIIRQRRCVFHQLELKQVDEEPNGRLVVPHDQCHELNIRHRS